MPENTSARQLRQRLMAAFVRCRRLDCLCWCWLDACACILGSQAAPQCDIDATVLDAGADFMSMQHTLDLFLADSARGARLVWSAAAQALVRGCCEAGPRCIAGRQQLPWQQPQM